MAHKSKRPGRRGYLEDFHQALDGEYIYTGRLWHSDKAARRKILPRLWTLAAFMALTALIPGFLPVQWMNGTAYVILPYILTLGGAARLLWLLGRISAGGEPLRDYIYQKTVPHLKGAALMSLVSGALAGAGLAVFLLRHGAGENGAEALVSFLCFGAQIALAALIRLSRIDHIWAEEDKAV